MNNKDIAELVKKLKSGRIRNRLIVTVGGMQHYVSCLEAADTIESLQAKVQTKTLQWAGVKDMLATELAKIKSLQARVAELEERLEVDDFGCDIIERRDATIAGLNAKLAMRND